MFFLIPCNCSYEPAKIVHEYHVQHKARSSSSDEGSSEGMTNDMSSCWMLSVIQALRASSTFQVEYAPTKNEENSVKSELFHLFDIVDGKNGESKRKTSYSETVRFKKLLIKDGLGVGMNDAFLEEPFLKFLLKDLGVRPITYQYGTEKKQKKSRLFRVPLTQFTEPCELQQQLDDQKIQFAETKQAPLFLPVYLQRPEEKRYYGKTHYEIEYARVPVKPTSHLYIAAGKKRACYELVSLVIGRDSLGHAYAYEVGKNGSWLEFNDQKVIKHEKPLIQKRRPNSHFTPFDDACKHAVILMYQFKGWS